MEEAAPLKQKSRAIYVILAVTFGFAGIHNIYAGYRWRAAAQIAITALSMAGGVITGLFGPIIPAVWALVEAASVTKDASGTPFFVRPLARRSRRVYVALALLLGIFGGHNFYAKYWDRGILQACVTLFGLAAPSILGYMTIMTGLPVDPTSPAAMVLPKLPWIVFAWALLEAWLVRHDARGQDFISAESP